MKRNGLIFGLLILGLSTGFTAPLGLFDDSMEIGGPDVDLISLVELNNGIYKIDTLGSTIGYRVYADEFTFLYKAMTGNFAIEGTPTPFGLYGYGGLMIRQELTNDSVHASLLMTADSSKRGTNSAEMSVYPTFRSIKGGATKTDGDPEPGGLTDTHTGKVRLERFGNTFYFYTFNTSNQPVLIRTEVVPMQDPVYVGLAVTAQTAAETGVFEFENVAVQEFPFTIERILPTDTLTPNATLTGVKLTAKIRAGQNASTTVHEIPPVGARFTNMKATTGQFTLNADGSFDWVLTNQTSEASLTYDVTLGSAKTVAWQGTYTDGSKTVYIGGNAILPKTPVWGMTMTPVKIDPIFPTKLEIEDFAPYEANHLWGLVGDPRLPSGVAAMSMNTSGGHAVEIPVQITKAGTYYVVGYARGEDGNSDSFFFELDKIPAADATTQWNISGSKTYLYDWVSRENPVENPRAFQLDVGEHFFYIGNREDDASVDFIVVTTNRNLNLSTFDLNAKAIVGRGIDKPFLRTGEKATVTVTVAVRDGVSDPVSVLETPPLDFLISNLAVTGGTTQTGADGTIQWDLTGITGEEAKLTYTLTPPSTTNSWSMAGTFAGSVRVGTDAPMPIGAPNRIAVEGIPIPSSGKTVAVFMDVPLNGISDQILVSDIRTAFGTQITLYDDGNEPGYVMPDTLSGVDMAFISESVGSGNVAGKNYHVNSAVPMVVTEQAVGDDFAYQAGVGNGTVNATSINIIDNTHPITQGFDLGVVQVYPTEMSMGRLDNPPAGVKVLATDPANPNRALLWVIEKGATVNNTTSPGLRVMMWHMLDGYTDSTTAGRQLMLQAIGYALGLEAPKIPTAVADFMLY